MEKKEHNWKEVNVIATTYKRRCAVLDFTLESGDHALFVLSKRNTEFLRDSLDASLKLRKAFG